MKRFELVIDAALEAKQRVPGLTVTVVGDGPLRPALQRRVDDAGASAWITLSGHISRDALLRHYRQAWLVVSGSLAEGWGLSLTEAAACGTPAIATDIRGHRSSVVDGVTGVLAPPERLAATIADVLLDERRRSQLATAALARARSLTWDASALGVTRVLHTAVCEHQADGR